MEMKHFKVQMFFKIRMILLVENGKPALPHRFVNLFYLSFHLQTKNRLLIKQDFMSTWVINNDSN